MFQLSETGLELQMLYVDQGYTGERFATAVLQLVGARVDVIKRNQPGFKVLPKRWIVERTLSWLGQNRRLSKDYELLPEGAVSNDLCCNGTLMIRRLTTNKFAA